MIQLLSVFDRFRSESWIHHWIF